MTSFRDRQRAAARARLEREMVVRAEAAHRRRRIKMIISSSTASVVVIGLVVMIVVLVASDDKKSANASASVGPCAYAPLADPSASGSPQPTPSTIRAVGTPPQASVVRKGVQLMTLMMNQGTVRAQIDTAKAPCTAASFTYLASKKFFDNTRCHRMSIDQMYILQCGDPSATGTGGPDYKIPDENLPAGKSPTYPEGTIAMANSGPNTAGSQFFIVFGDTQLDANYTVLGHVLQGLDVIKRIASGGVIPGNEGTDKVGAPKIDTIITSLTVDPPAGSLPKLPAVSVEPAASGSAAPSAAGSAPASSAASPSKS